MKLCRNGGHCEFSKRHPPTKVNPAAITTARELNGRVDLDEALASAAIVVRRDRQGFSVSVAAPFEPPHAIELSETNAGPAALALRQDRTTAEPRRSCGHRAGRTAEPRQRTSTRLRIVSKRHSTAGAGG